jgi:DNA-binding response OmpR family regulator
MGADGWLQKPITEERVLKAVRAMFARTKCA